MYLRNIKLWNFRKFGKEQEFNYKSPDLDLTLSRGLNVIIGENDSGKTAIVDAIKFVLKTHSYENLRITEDDFYKETNRLRIELLFSDLADEEAKHFLEWISWKEDNGVNHPMLVVHLDVRREGRILPSDVKAGPDEDGKTLTAEAREYLKVTYLKPLRDAGNELVAKKNSRLSQILINDPAFKGKEEDHYLVEEFNKLRDQILAYFSENTADPASVVDRTHGGKSISKKINLFLNKFYGAKRDIEFSTSKGKLRSILEKLDVLLTEEKNPGLGTSNLLFMAVELLHLWKDNWTGLRLGLIEELEAHLHPQAQMRVIETLQNQDEIQLILTSHSPNLASKVKLENLIICKDAKTYPMGADFTELDKKKYVFLEKFLDTTKANMFFAKGVILVEGWAEEILLPSIAKLIGIDLTQKGVSVVNIGHTGFDHYAKIYLRKSEPHMEIPVAVITDSDVRAYNKDGDLFTKKDKNTFEEEAGKKVEEKIKSSEKNVKYFIAKDWTLEYAIYKSEDLSELFRDVLSITYPIVFRKSDETDYELELAKKLYSKLEKTEIAYKLANKIDERITQQGDKGQIDPKDVTRNSSIKYLFDAIKYAANHN